MELSKKKIYAIVSDGWYSDEINPFVDSLHDFIQNIEIIRVRGCWEIPPKINQIIKKLKYVGDHLQTVVFIAIGAIVKGDTYHFEVLSHTVSDALMRLQLDYGVQIINQILNCYSVDQIKERMSADRAKYIVDTIFNSLINN